MEWATKTENGAVSTKRDSFRLGAVIRKPPRWVKIHHEEYENPGVRESYREYRCFFVTKIARWEADIATATPPTATDFWGKADPRFDLELATTAQDEQKPWFGWVEIQVATTKHLHFPLLVEVA